jgi:hypothetical protein
MANVMRHIRGDMNLVAVTAGAAIEEGDLLFLDNTDNKRGGGNSTADYKVYPFSSLADGANTNNVEASDQFAGIAMRAITSAEATAGKKTLVATTGDFKMPLAASTTCKVGYSVEPSGSADSSVKNQEVTVASSATNPLGICLSEGTLTSIHMRIRTILGEGIVS